MTERRPSKAKSIEILQEVLDQIPKLRDLDMSSIEFQRWQKNTETAIKNIFEDAEKNREFKFIRYYSRASIFSAEANPLEDREAYLRGLDSAIVLLEAMINEIEHFWGSDKSETTTGIAIEPTAPIKSSEIFIVHGRNDEIKEKVEKFLTKLKLKPIILHEQLDQGRTIIEKFEEHAQQTGFAVVLLTCDDLGSSKEEKDNLQPRARQNVIFELGYFAGKVSRKNVCILVENGVEIPSDYHGIVYKSLDGEESWKLELFKELQAAGFNLNPQDAIDAA